MRIRSWTSLLAAALLAPPASAYAQCGMAAGGGHDHGQQSGHQHEAKGPSKRVEEKAKRNAKKLLDDERGREALLEAVLEDAEFTQLLVTRLLEVPEWRAVISDRLSAAPNTGAATVGEDPAVPPSDPAPAQRIVYECPMHPEVVSDHPGACPKCGMKLERVQDQGSE